MILCAGLTPAWQQVLCFERFRVGEVNRATAVHWLAQGKAINAGIAAHHLGGPSLTLAPLGGPGLAAIRAEFAALAAPLECVETRAATRVCTTILDAATGTMTELVENGRPLAEDELAAFAARFAAAAAQAAVVVLAGSLPVGTPEAYYRRLLVCVPCPAVLDFRGAGLLGVLDLRPKLVKPNREELGHTLGRALDADADLVAAMRDLHRRGAEWVLVTAGPRPAWLLGAAGLFRVQPPRVTDVVNPIGSGDCLAAGIAWGLRAGRDMLDCVRLGMAAAAENTRRLDTGRLDPARVQAVARGVRVDGSAAA